MARFINGCNAQALYITTIQDLQLSDLTRAQFNWSYYGGQPDSVRLQNPWVGLWGRSGILAQDGRAIVGNDVIDRWGIYENQDQFRGGFSKWFYINGFCKDASNNPINGAIVQCFRTSDDTFTGFGVSGSDGSYSAPTPFNGQNHYLVAYYTGSPDIAGTTVNTLQPV